MKKIFLAAAAAIGSLFGCGRADKLVNPDGFVLEHPAIDVADPVATAAWWCENLGFTMTRQKDDETHTTFIVDASGRVAIEMYRAKTQPVAPDYASMDPLTLHFGFISKDVDADIERLTKAGATLVGAGAAIEKRFQGGGDALRAQGVRVESLARITAMDDTGVTFG